MKLISISLFNFRQFLGHQELRFGQDKDDIVTVVFGENGRGKTGIFAFSMSEN
jgi:DNA sulfur modification protein DndD